MSTDWKHSPTRALSYRPRTILTREQVRFYLVGFRCKWCGEYCDFQNPVFRSSVRDRAFMLQRSASDCVCPKCLSAEIILTVTWISSLPCDWCGRAGTVRWIANFTNNIITFGQTWWNGFQICPFCLEEGLHAAEAAGGASHVINYHHGKAYHINELGIRILANYE